MIFQKISNFIYFKLRKYSNPIGDPSIDRIVKISGKNVSVGAYTYGIEDIGILTWDENIKITIGRYCSIASGLKLYCGGNHRSDWLSTYPFGHVYDNIIKIKPVNGTPISKGNITIGNDVWIGRDVTILSGVTIGDGAIIASNSHVVKNVPPYSIVGGNPAKFIKIRFNDQVVEKLLSIKWWNLDINEIKNIIPNLCLQENENIDENINIILNKLNIENI